MGTYPDVALELLEATSRYRAQVITLENLQWFIGLAEMGIVDVEEAASRQFLVSAEGRLERMVFTIDPERLFTASLVVVGEVEAWAHAYLAGET